MPSSKKKRGKERKAAAKATAPKSSASTADGNDPYNFLNSADVAKNREQLMAERAAAGLDRIDPRIAKEERLPDYPSCDGCGKEYCGTMNCNDCQCSHYCSKECQVDHWKNGGHKLACSGLKERAENIAKSTVDRLNDESLPPLLRARSLDGDPLDMPGPYKFAVDLGLHEAIYSAFVIDQKSVVHNFTNPNPLFQCSLTQWIMISLFRGERISRKIHHQSNSFRKVDGERIKGYIESYPDDGLQVWWKATLESAVVFLHPGVSSPQEAFRLHEMAREILVMWTIVFTSKRAAQCILCTNAKTACSERATWMIRQIRPYLSKLQSAREGLDRNEVIQAYFNQIPAMIAAQCRDLGGVASIDPVKLLKLRGLDKKMYENIARPHGEDMVKTKRVADAERSKKILQRDGAFN